MTTTDTTMTPAPPGRTPWHKRRWVRVTAGVIAVPALIGIGASLGSAGSHTAAAPAKPAVTAPAHKAIPKPAAPAPASTAPAAQAPASAPAASSQVLLSTSGTGSYNSQPFQVTGNAPELKVTYSFSANTLPGDNSGDNFMMGIGSNDDTQSIANVIAASGGATTYLYPDTSSGDTTYHLTVTADGPWTVTITQVNG